LRYVRSGGTTNVEFRRILAASIHTPPPRCLKILRNCRKAEKDITDRLLICMLNIYPKKYCYCSSSFRHYVFTQILHCSHAVLDCVSLKAQVWTCPDRLTSLEQASGIAEPVLP
ncbi:hypothetical protein T10_4776, partial [Trichinella papuae]